MDKSKLNIDGVDIAFTRLGRGPALMLVHGYPLDGGIWDQVARILASDFDLLIPDLRGFGHSGLIEADRSILGYASDLAALMDILKIPRAYVAGHSMGGYVALAFARAYASKVAGLALVASQLLADSPERKEARRASAISVVKEGVTGVVESMAPKLSSDARVRALVREVIARQQPLGLAVALDAMAGRPDSTETFRASRFPVVIVHGDADELIPVERGREMKAALPSAHYLEIPGAGHMPMLENPAAVAEALRFMAVTPSRGVRILGR